MQETIILYTAREAAEILQCNPATVRKWCKKHNIGRHLGGRGQYRAWVITPEELQQLRSVQQRRVVIINGGLVTR